MGRKKKNPPLTLEQWQDRAAKYRAAVVFIRNQVNISGDEVIAVAKVLEFLMDEWKGCDEKVKALTPVMPIEHVEVDEDGGSIDD